MPPGLPIAGADPDEPTRSLPLAHFAAVAAAPAVGATGLVLVAPDLATGNLLAPRVLATTHVFTLGVIATAIFGAMYQFVPAVLGVPLRNRRIAWAGFALLETGLLALVAGLWAWRPGVQAAGWFLLVGAVGCAGWNILPARRSATRNRRVGLYISLAHTWLGMNMLVAGARIGDGLSWWHTDRAALIAAHFHLGAFGFAFLTIVAFGNRMVPAFLQAAGHPGWPFRWVGWVGSAGVALFATGEVAGNTTVRVVGASLMAAATILYLIEAVGYFRHRRDPDLDPGLGFIGTAHAGLGLTLLLGLRLGWSAPGPGRAWVAYAIMAILGWVTMMILGVMHRVVQRLVTQQLRIREGARAARLGRGDLIDRRLGWVTLVAFGSGTGILTLATSFSAVSIARTGASLVALAAGAVAWQGARLVRARFT